MTKLTKGFLIVGGSVALFAVSMAFLPTPPEEQVQEDRNEDRARHAMDFWPDGFNARFAFAEKHLRRSEQRDAERRLGVLKEEYDQIARALPAQNLSTEIAYGLYRDELDLAAGIEAWDREYHYVRPTDELLHNSQSETERRRRP